MWKRLRLKACNIIRRYLWRDHSQVETKWTASGPASFLESRVSDGLAMVG